MSNFLQWFFVLTFYISTRQTRRKYKMALQFRIYHDIEKLTFQV
uniref:Uncharacterized protein n=1 Tax=Arundo donax TaxID=35708 RepID=A0A0A9HQJ2_ARUDO